MKKIHIGGVFYGLHNIGDEAILFSIIKSFNEYDLSVSTYESEWIKKIDKKIEIRNFFVDYTKPQYGLFVNPKRDILCNIKKVKNEIDFFRKCDVYICGGATILSDCPWYSLRTVQLAGTAKIPIYLWGVGMADIKDKVTCRYIKNVLNKTYVKGIYVRDEYVKDRLCKIGVKNDKINICYDPAIMLRGTKDILNYLSDDQAKLYYDDHPNFVFSLSGESDVISRTPVDIIAEAIIMLQKKYSANIFLIPTGCGGHCKDTELLEQVSIKVNNQRIEVIHKEFSPSDLVGFLNNVEIIVSSRLHLNILGACAKVPSIGLVRNSKIIDFSNLIGMPYIKLEDMNSDKILAEVNKVLSNREKYVEGISSSVEKMRNKYMESLNEIKEKIGR